MATGEAAKAAIAVVGSGPALAKLGEADRYVLNLVLGRVSIDEVAPKDGQAIHEEIMAAVAEAETAEELFNPAELAKGLDLLGVAMRIDSVAFRPSGFPEGPAIYAIIDATLAEDHGDTKAGGSVRFSMGWADVLWRLYLARERGYLPTPFAVRFDRIAGETAGGFKPVKLRQA